MSTSGDVQYIRGYHEYIGGGGYHKYVEGCSVNWRFQQKAKIFYELAPLMNHDIFLMY